MASRDDDRFRVKSEAPRSRGGALAPHFISQALKKFSEAGAKRCGRQDGRPALLLQALRAESRTRLPDGEGADASISRKLLHLTGHLRREDLLLDIGLGRRIAMVVATRLKKLLPADLAAIAPARPEARDGIALRENVPRDPVIISGGAMIAVRLASCCRAVSGESDIRPFRRR